LIEQDMASKFAKSCHSLRTDYESSHDQASKCTYTVNSFPENLIIFFKNPHSNFQSRVVGFEGCIVDLEGCSAALLSLSCAMTPS
jgi:hypothetical protein